ncbi:efflux RND transporter periplasmic adaptor subunit [Shewanella avicenniae]|uniref:Efflux RND transporter periplasmic adaptor subunit n=1 Tax=Shewanella avicenniae TaxID=2814294 RepID=A0ABX7QMZ1_9GAMM|nr:efflux RND transporter periplasmic adaptor subunit [Shewanella avicenniae]QSX32819.1 efflux RND transporter periplasmic adaptor subunit [Shewanella avicenniae]
MKKSLKRKLIFVAVLVVIALAITVYYVTRPKPAPTYATEAAHRGNIENTVLANGMLQAYKLVNVGAQVSGQIKTLAVELGQEVKKGDLIAQIDSLTRQNSLKNAEASLNSIKAQYRAKLAQIHQAQLEYARQKAMLADNASSKADYEAAEATLTVYNAELEQLKAQQAQAEIQLDNARVDLGYTTITAPLDGTVVYNAVEVGQTVNSNQTTPTIVEMAQLSKMTVKAQISEADVVNVKPGQEVYFTILGNPNKKYFATLRAIEPGPTSMDGNDKDMTSSDSDAIYYNGLFDVDNADRALRIGMTAQVSIVLAQAKDVLLVPAQVLQTAKAGGPNKAAAAGKPEAKAKMAKADGKGAKQYQVPVLVDGKVEYRDVQVGINNKVYAEIVSGLNDGDEVVIGMPSATSYSSRFGRSVRL